MTNFILMTDSACDLPDSLAKGLGLTVLPLSITIEEKSYANYLDERELPVKAFYSMLREGKIGSTSAVNTATFIQAMEPFLQDGQDVLYLGFSSALSSTFNSAATAAAELRERYPERKIYALDTLCASLGQGLLVYLAAQKKLSGASIEEVVAYVEENRPHLCHWFTVDDLNHLHRGGRVSATSAVVGTVLNIKPVLHVDDEGRLINVSKVRGRKKSISALFAEMQATAINPDEQMIFISHGDCQEDADSLAEMIKAKYNVKDVIINHVGPVIGAHSGPGTLALFFLGEHR